MWTLCGVLFGVFLEYFTLLKGVSGVVQQACFSALVVCLLKETEFFVLFFPARPFSGLLGKADFYPFRFLTWMSWLESFICTPIKKFPFYLTWRSFPCWTSYQNYVLEGRNFRPSVGNGITKDFIYFFGGNILGGVRSKEERKEVIAFRLLYIKSLEGHVARFIHCTPHCEFLLGNCIHWERVLK